MRALFMRAVPLLLTAGLLMPLCACSDAAPSFKDGFYTAETEDFDSHGWKEYLTICVSGGRIVAAEYDARNASGLVKSWDMDYMRRMDAIDGTYPNEYTRLYSKALLSWQDPARVDAVSGATNSHDTFVRLAQAALEQSREGSKRIALIELREEKEGSE